MPSPFDDLLPRGERSPAQPVTQSPVQVSAQSVPDQARAKSASSDYQRLTTYVRTATIRRLKIVAAETGKDLSDISQEALESWLSSREGK